MPQSKSQERYKKGQNCMKLSHGFKIQNLKHEYKSGTKVDISTTEVKGKRKGRHNINSLIKKSLKKEKENK